MSRFPLLVAVIMLLIVTSPLTLSAQTSGAKRIMPGVTSEVPDTSAATTNGTSGTSTSASKTGGATDSDTGVGAAKEVAMPFDPAKYGKNWLTMDRNGDGTIDYAVQVNSAGEKVKEALDFNYDGRMDDFVYYVRGVPVREEIDSNYDGKIDVWIYLYKGVYIRRYEQDTNFDGKPDVIKDYDKKK